MAFGRTQDGYSKGQSLKNIGLDSLIEWHDMIDDGPLKVNLKAWIASLSEMLDGE